MPGTTICRGNLIASWITAPSLTPVAVAQNTTAEQTFTVKDVHVGDVIQVSPAAAQTAGVGIVGVRVSAKDVLAITYVNATSGSLTPVAGVHYLHISRPESVADLTTNGT